MVFDIVQTGAAVSGKQTSWGTCTGKKGRLGPQEKTLDDAQLSWDRVNKPGMKND